MKLDFKMLLIYIHIARPKPEQQCCIVRTNAFLKILPEMVTFMRVAELGSFSAAASQLGMTPSAASRQVARLEKELGVQLIQRTTRQLRLTEPGVEAFAHCRDLVAAAQAMLQVAQQFVSEPRGRVRVSAPKAFARHVLHPLLVAFLERYPSVDVQLIVADRDIDPIREGVDLVVRLTCDPPQGLVARPLAVVRQVLCAAPRYLEERGAVEHPRDLLAHSCLYLGEQACDNRWRFRKGDEVVDVIVQGRYVANHSEIRLDGVRRGLGVGCVPDFVVRKALDRGDVVRVLQDWEFQANYDGQAYLMFPPNTFMVSKCRALIDHLTAALAGGLE